MLAAILGISILSVIGASYLKFALHERRLSSRAHDLNGLTYIAEAGLEEGIWAINNDDWTYWQSLSGVAGKYRPPVNVTLGNNRLATFKVIVLNSGSTVTVYSSAVTTFPDGNSFEKQMRVVYNPVTNKPGGLIAKGKMDLSGGNMYFDSYDSSIGVPNATLNRTDEVTVATVSTSSDALKYNSGVYIYGFAGTGQRPPIKSPVVHVYGASSTETYDTSRVSQDFNFEFPEVVEPSWSGAITSISDSGTITLGNPSDMSPRRYKVDKIDISDGDKVEVVGPVQIHLEDGMSVSGSAEINIDSGAYIEIYSPKDFTFSGNVVVNDDHAKAPKNFKLFGTASSPGDQTLSVSGQSHLNVVFEGINSKVNMSGQAFVAGSIIGNEITVSGQVEFHYDVTLGGGGTGGEGISTWHELISPSDKIDFASYTSS